jgi:ATP-dependent DNA ligase
MLSELLNQLKQQQQPQKKRKLYACCYCGEKYRSIFPKDPDSHYQLGKRGKYWMKLKKELDTIDAIYRNG